MVFAVTIITPLYTKRQSPFSGCLLSIYLIVLIESILRAKLHLHYLLPWTQTGEFCITFSISSRRGLKYSRKTLFGSYSFMFCHIHVTIGNHEKLHHIFHPCTNRPLHKAGISLSFQCPRACSPLVQCFVVAIQASSFRSTRILPRVFSS